MLPFTLPLNEVVNSRSEPGIIIFNLGKQITYANQIALDTFISESATHRNNQPMGTFKLPSEISRIHAELKSRLYRFAWNSCPDAVYLKKIISIRHVQYIIRAFIISDSQKRSSAHFLVLFDKLFVRSKFDLEPARLYFKLSLKEFEVVRLLIGGRTNKEIANKLKIAESTVKEYMRKIMRKATSTTRAGVVAKILSLSSKDTRSSETNEEVSPSPSLRSRNLSRASLEG